MTEEGENEGKGVLGEWEGEGAGGGLKYLQ